MITLRKLLWDSWNISHIARHKIVPEEVEAVCHGSPVVQRGQQKGRLLLIGSTEEENIIVVILEAKGKSVYYVITAYPADKKDCALYKRLKGGEKK